MSLNQGRAYDAAMPRRLPRLLAGFAYLSALLAPLAARADVEEDRITAAITDALKASDPRSQHKGVTWTDWRTDTEFEPSGEWILQTPNAWGQDTFVGSDPSCQGGASCDTSLHLLKCEQGKPSQTTCFALGAGCRLLASTGTTPGEAPRSVCAGQADLMLDELYKVLVKAQSSVDIVSLTFPDGRFRDMLRNALSVLARSGRPVTVRILSADFTSIRALGGFSQIDVNKLLEDVLVLANESPQRNLKVYAGRMRVSASGLDGWPHSKIIAVDGQWAVVGGQNMWTADYLARTPVWDLNLRLKGSAARDAHRFLDEHWKHLCDNAGALSKSSRNFARLYDAAGNQPGVTPLKLNSQCLKALPVQELQAEGGARVMGVGKLGALDLVGGDQSLAAHEALIRAAGSAVYLSQQNLQGAAGQGFEGRIMDAIADQLIAGRDVFLVQSGDGANKGSIQPYSNGSLLPMARKMRRVLRKARGAPSELDAVNDLLCQRFHLAPMRFHSTSAVYANTTETIPNHSKFILADQTAFYVGSHNLYPSGKNMEYGYVVADSRLGKVMFAGYWNKLWSFARLTAISGSDAPRCIYKETTFQE